MDFSFLLGPAVIAALVAAPVAIWSAWRNMRLARELHAEKLSFESEQLKRKVTADLELAEKKFAFDRDIVERKASADLQLAEKKLALDRALAAWKRRTELAEAVLVGFYSARALFRAARFPGGREGEGETRSRSGDESADDARYRDAIYRTYERLVNNNKVLAELQAHRYRFMALFGEGAGEPFGVFDRALAQVEAATRLLLSPKLGHDFDRSKSEAIIGWGSAEEDPIGPMLDDAVATIEAICRPVLGTEGV